MQKTAQSESSALFFAVKNEELRVKNDADLL